MSTERAIVELVVQGAAQVDSTNDKIKADLTSVERSGKKAEEASNSAARASRNAESAAQSLGSRIPQLIGKLERALRLVQKGANALGLDANTKEGIVAEEAVNVASSAAAGFRAGGPAGLVIGTAIGIDRAIKNTERRFDELAERQENQRQDEILDALFREAGLDHLEHGRAPNGRRVQ